MDHAQYVYILEPLNFGLTDDRTKPLPWARFIREKSAPRLPCNSD